MHRKKVVILGSTGSIGENAVKIAQHLPQELDIVGVVANTQITKLAEQASLLQCNFAITSDHSRLGELEKNVPSGCKALAGPDAILDLVTRDDVDIVLCAIVGTGGLMPVIEAIRAGKDIALASKEVLVMAGELVMAEVEKAGVQMLPVDSEHSALFQCLEGKKSEDVSRLILTASGGAFRNTSLEEMHVATYEHALAHPTWNMGPKVTIDSASLMNKALEIVEARWLFNIPGDRIDAVIHPQSVVHSMVEFVDGTMLAQMSSPDMRFPIQYALTYPHKHPGTLEPLDFTKYSQLTFELPDESRFPSLEFAHESLRQCGTMPAVMNAANEIAVQAFSDDKIRFTDIWKVIEKTMKSHDCSASPSLEQIIDADHWARLNATQIYKSL